MNNKNNLAKLIRLERLAYERMCQLQTWRSVVRHVRIIHKVDRTIIEVA